MYQHDSSLDDLLRRPMKMAINDDDYEYEYEDMYSWNGDWVTTYTIYGYDENDNIIMFESQNSKFLGVKKGETVKVSGTPSYKGTRKNGDKYTKLNRVIHRG